MVKQPVQDATDYVVPGPSRVGKGKGIDIRVIECDRPEPIGFMASTRRIVMLS